MARIPPAAVRQTPSPSTLDPPGGEDPAALRRELEVDNEELQETNRQLIATIEEIQSLNVTLQSVNGALHATNVNLRSEAERLQLKSRDLDSMLDGIELGAVLVDAAMALRHYNAAASRYFTLDKGDIGKPLGRVRHSLGQAGLLDLCRGVLQTGAPIERTLSSPLGPALSLRIREVALGPTDCGVMLTVAELAPPSEIS